MVELLEIGVIAALGAWAFTQIHLLFVVKAVKKDIDTKRTATEAFVDDRLKKIENLMGAHQASLTAQIPPNVHGELEQLQEHFDGLDADFKGFIADVKARFDGLPEAVRFTLVQEEGRQSQEMFRRAKELNADMSTELAAINASIPQAQDLRGKVLKAISREPSKKEVEKMGMVGELIWNFGRMKAAEWLQSEGPPGASVTYRVTSKSPYGL